MAEVVLFHHALGLTDGCRALADALRSAGHAVHAPDVFDGATFATVDDGVAHAESIGFGTIVERGAAAVRSMPQELVYMGLSLGVLPAQMLAQTRSGALGAVLLHSTVPLSEFGGSWPSGVPGQIHTMVDDEWGDVDVAREVAASTGEIELFLYPGDRHLFTDASLADHYDPGGAAQVLDRVLALLAEVDASS
ncbi:MAG: dienelactone hydrolase family protein [Acidimicrobiales bacterium]